MSFREKFREGFDEGYGTDYDIGARRVLFFLGLIALCGIIVVIAL